VNIPKRRFQPNENEVVMQSWLNISNDPIVGADKKKKIDSFCMRIDEAYNMHAS